MRTAISLTSSILIAQFRILILEFNEFIDYQLLNFFILVDSSAASSQYREQGIHSVEEVSACTKLFKFLHNWGNLRSSILKIQIFIKIMKNFLLILSALIVAAHTNYPVVQSCDDVYKSGPYTLKTGDWEVELECDAETDGGGWHTILVRRGGENFYKNWRTYADDGIGSPETEYFLPLNFLHYLTSEDTYELLVEMREGREYSWALY